MKRPVGAGAKHARCERLIRGAKETFFDAPSNMKKPGVETLLAETRRAVNKSLIHIEKKPYARSEINQHNSKTIAIR